MGKVDYSFPLPVKFLRARYGSVFKNLEKGLSVTIVGLPLSSRSAFLKFILESDTKFSGQFLNLDKFDFLTISGKNLSDADLLKTVLIKVASKLNIPVSDNFDPLLVQHKIEQAQASNVLTKKILIFIPDFYDLLKEKPETIEFLTRLGKINKHNPQKNGFLFCFTSSPKEMDTASFSFPFEFCQFLRDSTIEFGLLNKKELEYTKLRLEFFRNKKVDPKTHSIAQKLSLGHYILYKTLTSFELKEIEKINKIHYHPILTSVISQIWNGLGNNNSKIKSSPLFPPKVPKEIISSESVLPLTAQEADVFSYIQKKLGLITSRDEIGQVMWGKAWIEKYSDWAIDKLISKLKSKLIYSSYKIQTVRGKGYKLIKHD